MFKLQLLENWLLSPHIKVWPWPVFKNACLGITVAKCRLLPWYFYRQSLCGTLLDKYGGIPQLTSLLNRKLSSKPHREYHVEGKRPSGEEQQRKWYSQECYVPCQKERSKAIINHLLWCQRLFTPLYIKPCSQYAKFCLFCKKICQKEVISSVNDFFHLPKFSKVPPNFKREVLEAYNFCQATKSFVPWQLSFVRLSYFINMTNQCSFNWSFWLYKKFSMSQMQTRLQKKYIGDNKIVHFFA